MNTLRPKTILKHTTSPRDSNPLSLVVYHDFYGQASNMLQYSVTLLTTFIGGGRALSDCHGQALFLVATIVKHTTELCWTYLSAKTCAMCFNIIDRLLSFWPSIRAPFKFGGVGRDRTYLPKPRGYSPLPYR